MTDNRFRLTPELLERLGTLGDRKPRLARVVEFLGRPLVPLLQAQMARYGLLASYLALGVKPRRWVSNRRLRRELAFAMHYGRLPAPVELWAFECGVILGLPPDFIRGDDTDDEFRERIKRG